MRSRCRPGRPVRSAHRTLLALLVGVALGVAVSACAGADAAGPVSPPSGAASPTSAPAPAVPSPQIDERVRAGVLGRFVAVCPLSHRSPDDPIVHPHESGHHVASAHSHDFYGNTTTDAHSTPASLLAGTTTCDLGEDLSSYWMPTLTRAGVALDAEQFAAYYDTAPGIDPATAAPIPSGLAMIAGNGTSAGAPDEGVSRWTCGRGGEPTVQVPTCPFTSKLTLHLTFPDCWDGRQLDSTDHRSHVAYSSDGRCPATHPVAMIRLVLRVRFPVYGDASDLALSSGGLETAHADFMNAWTEQGMRDFVDLCIRRRVTCGEA